MTERTVVVGRDVRAEMRAAAEQFRQEQARHGTLVVRLLSSPGAGKTRLLEATAGQLGRDYSLGILVGDIETDRDAQRLAPYAPTVQITTGGCCHLELPLVRQALPKLPSEPRDFLFIEDVGNLVCPASHDLGEHLRVVLLSTPEGDDKPGKYPKAFRTSQALVLSKIDLLPVLPFDARAARLDAQRIQPDLRVFEVSALTGAGVADWCAFLVQRRELLRSGS